MSSTPVTLHFPTHNPAFTKLLDAIFIGDLDLVEKLLKSSPKIDLTLREKSRQMSILMVAIMHGRGRTDIAKALLLADPNLADLQANDGTTALIIAAGMNSIEIIQAILEIHPNPDHQGPFRQTALMLAAMYGFVEALELLLGAGAKTDLQDENGNTALMLATEAGQLEAVRILLDAGAAIDSIDKEGYPVFVTAVEEGRVEIIRLFLKKININQKYRQGETALMIAAQYDHAEALEVLLKEGAELDLQANSGHTALMMAAERGHVKALQRLLKAKADIEKEDKEGNTALMLAIAQKQVASVQILLEANADRNHRNIFGFNALTVAASGGGIRSREWLRSLMSNSTPSEGKVEIEAASIASDKTSSRSKPKKQSKKAVNSLNIIRPEKIISNGQFDKAFFEIICLLKSRGEIDYNSQIRENGYTPLMVAVEMGHVKAIPELLGGDITIKNEMGEVALLLAVEKGNIEIFQMLLEANLKLEWKNKQDLLDLLTSCLSVAAHRNQVEIIHALLATKLVDVNRKDSKGCVALGYAASAGHLEATQSLLKAKADVNQDIEGTSLLLYAADSGKPEITRLLIESNFKLRNEFLSDSYHEFLGIKNGDLCSCGQVECRESIARCSKGIDNTVFSALMLKRFEGVLEKENLKRSSAFRSPVHPGNLDALRRVFDELLKQDKAKEYLGFVEGFLLKIKTKALMILCNTPETQHLRDYVSKEAEAWCHIPFWSLANKLKSSERIDVISALISSALERSQIEIDLEKESLNNRFSLVRTRLNQIDNFIEREKALLKILEERLPKREIAESSYFFEAASTYSIQAQTCLQESEDEYAILGEMISYLSDKMSHYLKNYKSPGRARRVVERLEAIAGKIDRSLKQTSEFRVKADSAEASMARFKEEQAKAEQAKLKKLKKLEYQKEKKREYEIELEKEKEKEEKERQDKLHQLKIEKEISQRRRAEYQLRKEERKKKHDLEKQLASKKPVQTSSMAVLKHNAAETRKNTSKRYVLPNLENLTGLGSRLEGLEIIKKLEFAFGAESKTAVEDREVRLIERDALLGALAGMLEEIKENKATPIPFKVAQSLRNLLYHTPKLMGDTGEELVSLRQLVFLLNEKFKDTLEKGTKLGSGVEHVTIKNSFLDSLRSLGSKPEYQAGYKLIENWLDLAKESEYARKMKQKQQSLGLICVQIKRGEQALARCAKDQGLDKQIIGLAERYNYACLGAQAAEILAKISRKNKKPKMGDLTIPLLLKYIELGKKVRHPKAGHHFSGFLSFNGSLDKDKNKDKEKNDKPEASSKKEDKPDSPSSSTKKDLFFQFSKPRIHDVSAQGNNCGLFALTLGVKLALESNSKLTAQARLPAFITSVNKTALQLGTRETMEVFGKAKEELTQETREIGKLLREALHTALLSDISYQNSRFSNFTSLCVDYLEKRPLAVDMNSFKIPNGEFLRQLESHWEMSQKNLHDKIYKEILELYHSYLKNEIAQQDIGKLRTDLSSLVPKREVKALRELFEQYFSKLSDPSIDPLRNLIEIRQLFSTAWRGVTNGRALDRGWVFDTVSNLLMQRLFDIIKFKKFGGTQKEYLNALLLYALSENTRFNERGVLEKIGNKEENISSVVSLFVQNQLTGQWDSIYKKYCDYLKNSQEFLTADELGCLSSAWGVQLKIKFASGSPYTSYGETSSPELLHVTLCNPSQIHWNVISQDLFKNGQENVLEIIAKIQDVEFKKRLIESVKSKEAYEKRLEDFSYLQGFLSVIEYWASPQKVAGSSLLEVDVQLIKQLSNLFQDVGIWKISAEAIYELAEPLEKLLKLQEEEIARAGSKLKC